MRPRLVMEVRDLHKVYRTGKIEVHALRGIDLTVEQGEFISVMGRSGSGKSTLLNMIGCLDRPTSGSVVVDGIDVTTLKRGQLPIIRSQKVGFVFQQFNLIPTLTALENVMLPLRYAQVPSHRRRVLALEGLARVGLIERSRHRPSELSGGEQQRVAIARALVNRPAIILADEPTGELDSHTALEIILMMKELNQEQRQAFIIVTHDPMVANQTSRLIRLQDGTIESDVRQNADCLLKERMEQ